MNQPQCRITEEDWGKVMFACQVAKQIIPEFEQLKKEVAEISAQKERLADMISMCNSIQHTAQPETTQNIALKIAALESDLQWIQEQLRALDI